MKISKLLVALLALALLSVQSRAQDKSERTLQGWLDFLNQDASLASVINRIGTADKEKSVEKVSSNAQMYIWYNRFENAARKDNRLEMVAVPEEVPGGPSRMMVVALLDPLSGRGIYLPWAWRFLDSVPNGTFIPRNVMGTLVD